MTQMSAVGRCTALSMLLLLLCCCCVSSWAMGASSGTEAAAAGAADLSADVEFQLEHEVDLDLDAVASAPPPRPSLLSQLGDSTLHSLRIVASFPHDVTHFTQGFTADNDPTLPNHQSVIELYESTGIWGGTAVHKYTLRIDDEQQRQQPQNGQTSAREMRLQRSLTLPMSVFGEGVCVIDNTLLQLTYQNGIFIQYNKKALSSNSDGDGGSPKRTRATPKQAVKLAYPTSAASMVSSSPAAAAAAAAHVFKEGWGVTFDTQRRRVVVSDGSSTLFLLRPDALHAVESTIDVHYFDQRGHRHRVDALNELEYIAPPPSNGQPNGGVGGGPGEIFANYYESDCILRIDPLSGRVRGVLHADHGAFYTGPVRAAGRKAHRAVEAMNGVAFHEASQTLLVTGKNWPRVFEVAVDKHPHAPPSPPPPAAGAAGAATAAAKDAPLGFDLDRVCPRASMSSGDMAHWQQLLAETARAGMEDEQMAGETLPVAKRKQRLPEHKWSAVPPQTQKITQVQRTASAPSTTSTTTPGGAAAPLHATAPRFTQVSHAASALDAMDARAASLLSGGADAAEEALSAETQAALAEAAESAAQGGQDALAADFDSRAHVAHEFARMRREERRERRERRRAAHQRPAGAPAAEEDEDEAPRVDFHFIQLGEREVLSGDFD